MSKWKQDPEYQRLLPAQQKYVDAVLNNVHALYAGGRQTGKSTMYRVIMKWLKQYEYYGRNTIN